VHHALDETVRAVLMHCVSMRCGRPEAIRCVTFIVRLH
jgi:hypothetical protein